LSANVIAGIYMGKITNWNDSAIRAANHGVNLPDHSISPIHRSDGSGDTFMFTSFLSKGNSTWNTTIGASTAPNWPSVSKALTGDGNTGIIATMKSNQYSIGYIAATYNKTVTADGFGIAHLQNRDGKYVSPTVQNVITAASKYLNDIPASGTIALQYAPGPTSYPIADMEYVIVKQNQTSQAKATAMQDFLKWAVSSTGGSQSKYLDQLDLAPLPPAVVNNVTIPLINKIAG
ncbi:MAG TPA: substrate-binding domain-containing protein, partial [Thermoplasmataceae archaeon]|nr:substrate-binding domain-containing protein [Thermoplasmataceae archaeon]